MEKGGWANIWILGNLKICDWQRVAQDSGLGRLSHGGSLALLGGWFQVGLALIMSSVSLREGKVCKSLGAALVQLEVP